MPQNFRTTYLTFKIRSLNCIANFVSILFLFPHPFPHKLPVTKEELIVTVIYYGKTLKTFEHLFKNNVNKVENKEENGNKIYGT